MKTFFTNICCVSAVLRRTAAQNLVVLATNSRKPVVFTSWLLNTACNMLLPLGKYILVVVVILAPPLFIISCRKRSRNARLPKKILDFYDKNFNQKLEEKKFSRF